MAGMAQLAEIAAATAARTSQRESTAGRRPTARNVFIEFSPHLESTLSNRRKSTLSTNRRSSPGRDRFGRSAIFLFWTYKAELALQT
jgi:hypothetical protein